MPATRIVPPTAVPMQNPRFDTLRDGPEIFPWRSSGRPDPALPLHHPGEALAMAGMAGIAPPSPAADALACSPLGSHPHPCRCPADVTRPQRDLALRCAVAYSYLSGRDDPPEYAFQRVRIVGSLGRIGTAN